MAANHEAGEANMAPGGSLRSGEIDDLLKAIHNELKSIRSELKRQDEQLRLGAQSTSISHGHIREEMQNRVSRIDRS
jgi:hypothetical protein